MEIHKKIALARKRKGLTQEQLADLTNITVRTIQRIESGQGTARAFTLKTIAEVLGITFEELIGEPKNVLTSLPITENSFDPAEEKHFLKIFCLSCFAYLVIPFVHFLLPVYLLKRKTSINAGIRAFARAIILQQIYWAVTLSLLLMLTLVYNLITAVYFKEFYLMSYLWIFCGMYVLNALLILINLYRVKAINITPVSAP